MVQEQNRIMQYAQLFRAIRHELPPPEAARRLSGDPKSKNRPAGRDPSGLGSQGCGLSSRGNGGCCIGVSLAAVCAIVRAESPPMPDFVKLRLGAPVKAEFEFRSELKQVEVDGHFEVVVPMVPVGDTVLVAVVERDRKRIPYRLIGERLFRPMTRLMDGEAHMADNVNPRRMPKVVAAPIRRIGARRTPLLGSPWLEWEPEGQVTDALRDRVRKVAPQAWRDAATRLQEASTRGLRVVDGVIFRETRAPAWGFTHSTDLIAGAIPDTQRRLPSVLIDPRIPNASLRAFARETGQFVARESFRVLEPSLLPDTFEADALSAFGLGLLDRVGHSRVSEYDVDALIDILALFQRIENAVSRSLPFEDCYSGIERLADRRIEEDRIQYQHEVTSNLIASAAFSFSMLRLRFPAPARIPAPDSEEAESIADAFRP